MADAGREQTFRRIFARFHDDVARYCLRRLPIDDVDDVVADVFVVAWQKLQAKPQGDDALPWLYGVARNEIRNRRRSQHRWALLQARLAGDAQSGTSGPEPIVVMHDEIQTVTAAMARLKTRDRETLLLRTHEELDFRQIGMVLGCSPEAARKRLVRAVARLRRAMPTSAGGSRGRATSAEQLGEQG